MRSILIALCAAAVPVCAQLDIAPPTPTLPAGSVGQIYPAAGAPFAAVGGTSPYTWSYTGTLPTGISLTTGVGAGILSGTPEGCVSFWATASTPCSNAFEPMISAFTVQVQDSSSPTPLIATQTYPMQVYWNLTEAQYLSTESQYLSSMAAITGTSQPPLIATGGHLGIANPIFRNASYDNQAAWNAWISAMRAAGMKRVNIEVDLECLVDVRPSCLALYAGSISYAHQLGMSVSLNPSFYSTQSCGDAPCAGNGPTNGMLGACLGIGITINGTHGSVYTSGVGDWLSCVTTAISGLGGYSAYQYMLVSWLQNGDQFVPVHEPTTQTGRWNEGFASSTSSPCNFSSNPAVAPLQCNAQYGAAGPNVNGNTCPQDWLVNFLQPFFTALSSWQSSSPIASGIQYGVTVEYTIEMTLPPPTGSSYAAVFAAGLPSSVRMGMDIYSFTNSATVTDYLQEYLSTIALFKSYGHSVFVEEYGVDQWHLKGAPNTEACAIVGRSSCTWNTLNQNFFAALLPFLASQGITDASLFDTQILAQCAPAYPDSALNPLVLATATTAMQNGQFSVACVRHSSLLSQWGAGSMAGATVSGAHLAAH